MQRYRQIEVLKKHLDAGNLIDSDQAREMWGIRRLAARVFDSKESNYPVARVAERKGLAVYGKTIQCHG